MDEGRKHFAGLTLSPVDDDETLITVIPSLSRPIQEPLTRCIMLHDASDVWAKASNQSPHPQTILAVLRTFPRNRSTGLSERKGAKLSEFSLTFPKLADLLCMGWSVCRAAAKAGNPNKWTFLNLPVVFSVGTSPNH